MITRSPQFYANTVACFNQNNWRIFGRWHTSMTMRPAALPLRCPVVCTDPNDYMLPAVWADV